jgi:hypothetical protein
MPVTPKRCCPIGIPFPTTIYAPKVFAPKSGRPSKTSANDLNQRYMPVAKAPPEEQEPIYWAQTTLFTAVNEHGEVKEYSMTPMMSLVKDCIARVSDTTLEEDQRMNAMFAMLHCSEEELKPFGLLPLRLFAESRARLLHNDPKAASNESHARAFRRRLKDTPVRLALLNLATTNANRIDAGQQCEVSPECMEAHAFEWQQEDAVDEAVAHAASEFLEQLYAPGSGTRFLSAQTDFETFSGKCKQGGR